MRDLFGIVDIGVLVVVVLAAAMPPREMLAGPAIRGSEDLKFELALAEARTQATPMDGARVDEYAHKLGDTNGRDWAIQVAVDGARRTKGAPEEWRAQLAASTAYVDRLEAKRALEYAGKALTACKTTPDTCPEFELTRMDIYRQHLEAGIKSGAVDANGHVKDAKKFREAGEGRIRSIRIGH